MSGRPFFRLCAGAGCPRRERRTACMKYARAHLPMIALVLLAALPAMVSAQVVEAGPVDKTAIDQAFDDTVARYHLPGLAVGIVEDGERSEEPTYELQSLMRISYAVICLKKKNQ